MDKIRKIVVAYSGGLDTSVMLSWLKERYQAEIIACAVDVGQGKELKDLKQRALKTGASKVYIIDAKKEFAYEYIFKAIKAHALYEGKYYLGTSLARPLIAQKIIEVAKIEKADAVAHGATGKGNDQVRFELSFKALMPDIKIIAPWREWDLKSREDEIDYAKRNNIPVPVTKEKPYSSDANMWHISYEGGILEDLENEYDETMFQLTVYPKDAPDKPLYLTIDFEKGIPVGINGKKMDGVNLIQSLNKVAGKHGIGRVDIVENRLVGMKSRGVYESPAACVLYAAHRELESITLDRETFHFKESISPRYGEIVYYGQWFSPLREALDAFIDKTQENVTGRIGLRLYKGNIDIASRKSPYSLYMKELATFSKDEMFNQKDAEGFINLFGLPIKVNAILKKSKQ